MAEKFLIIIELDMDENHEARVNKIFDGLASLKDIEGTPPTLKLVKGDKANRILDIFWEPENV